MDLGELVRQAEDEAPEDWADFALKAELHGKNLGNIGIRKIDIVTGEIILCVKWG